MRGKVGPTREEISVENGAALIDALPMSVECDDDADPSWYEWAGVAAAGPWDGRYGFNRAMWRDLGGSMAAREAYFVRILLGKLALQNTSGEL